VELYSCPTAVRGLYITSATVPRGTGGRDAHVRDGDGVLPCLDEVDEVDEKTAVDQRIEESLQRNKESMEHSGGEDRMAHSGLDHSVEEAEGPSEDEHEDVLTNLVLDASPC
jgi:hypothetical protein